MAFHAGAKIFVVAGRSRVKHLAQGRGLWGDYVVGIAVKVALSGLFSACYYSTASHFS